MKYWTFFMLATVACLMVLAGCEKKSTAPEDVNAYDPDLDGLPHMITVTIDPTLAEDQRRISQAYASEAGPVAPASPGATPTPKPATAPAGPAASTPKPSGPPTPGGPPMP